MSPTVERFGATQVTIGSDFPFAIADAELVARIRRLDLDADRAGAARR